MNRPNRKTVAVTVCRLLLTAIVGLLLFVGFPHKGTAQTGIITDPASEAVGAGQASGDGATAPQAAPASNSALLFPKELANKIQRQSTLVDQLAQRVERDQRNDDRLTSLRSEIVAVGDRAAMFGEQLSPHIITVERLITGLGEKPKDGDAAETPAIAAERERLEDVRQRLQGARQRAKLAEVRAKQLLSRIQSLRLANLRRNLGTRHPGPLSAAHWQELGKQLPRFGTQIATVSDNWWTVAQPRLHWLVLNLAGGAGLWWMIRAAARNKVRDMMRQPLQSGPPAYLARVSMALRSFPLTLAAGVSLAGFLYFMFWLCGLFNDQIDGLALSALKASILYIVTQALAKAILLPWEPSWRLIGLPTPLAKRYLLLIRLIAGVYCLDMWLTETFAALQVPEIIGLTAGYGTNLAFAGLLFASAWLPLGSEPEQSADAGAGSVSPDRSGVDDQVIIGGGVSGNSVSDHAAAAGKRERVSARLVRKGIYWLRVPASLAVLVIFVSTLLGYLALGRFIAGQVMLIGIGASALVLGHLAARALVLQPDALSPRLDDLLQDRLSLSARRRQQAFGFFSFLLNLILIVAAVSMLLISWGYSDAELLGWGKSLLFGFEIGKFKFSLLQVLIALCLFVGVIVLTRLFQAWLSRKVLQGEQVDRGIANSIHSGVGYTGVALAALIGVSYAGLDLSNIALIASALSIGIGFGLNAIASNFVSGLIMLIERPIKVGDWVVVGAHQGYVRHISVRATEIETFDRASVIIPNSDFMTSAVQNWTHRNAMGRVIVNVGASYSADPNQVISVLEKVAKDCDLLLTYPPPSVHFEDFGASSLDFSVRGYIADVNSMLSTKTALRLGIANAFKEANIEIPFPQQDVHLRDLDGVRELIGHVMAARAEKAAREQSMMHENDNGDGDNRKT